jgi:glycosyltransferase involved in cell wall biosynthesis
VLAWRQQRAPYDYVHVHSVPDFLVFSAWAPKLGGAGLMLDIHDVLPEFYASKFKIDRGSLMFRALLTAERWSCAFADHVIAANHLWQKKLESRAVPPGKSSVFLNYPNRSVFYHRQRTAIPGRFRIIFPGSLNSHQGVDLAIRAFATVCKQVPEAEFHIYGEGGAKESLVELAHSLHLEDRVRFHKFVPLREIAPIMAEADIAVVPKRSDSFGEEAFSTKILEFMSLGVPVIVSDTKIDRYYFNDSVVRFFRGGDHEDLAAAILQLVKDPGFRERIERNAAEFVADFDWASKRKEYFELVDSLAR